MSILRSRPEAIDILTRTDIKSWAMRTFAGKYSAQLTSQAVEDAYGHALEAFVKTSNKPKATDSDVKAWLYRVMNNHLTNELKKHGRGRIEHADAHDSNGDGATAMASGLEYLAGQRQGQSEDPIFDEVSTLDDELLPVLRFRQEFLLVTEAFPSDQEKAIASLTLLFGEEPQYIAREYGYDENEVKLVAKRVRALWAKFYESALKDPGYRCKRQRKHHELYQATGETPLGLEVHWATCNKCKTAKRAADQAMHAALAPFLPAGAAAAGGGTLLTRLLHHAAKPHHIARRLLGRGAQAGAKAGATTQVAGATGTVASHIAVAAAVAAVGGGAVVGGVALVNHITAHHPKPKTIVHHYTPAPTTTPVNTTPLSTTPKKTAANPTHHRKPAVRHHHKKKHLKRRAHVATTTTATPPPTTTTPPVTTTTATTTVAPPPATTTTTATTKPATTSTTSQLANPSYTTPNSPSSTSTSLTQP